VVWLDGKETVHRDDCLFLILFPSSKYNIGYRVLIERETLFEGIIQCSDVRKEAVFFDLCNLIYLADILKKAKCRPALPCIG
jgi:hypothetical protein